jgi:hypothetical protein
MYHTHAISEVNFYRWKAKYSDMDVRQLRQLQQLEEEKLRFKTKSDKADRTM